MDSKTTASLECFPGRLGRSWPPGREQEPPEGSGTGRAVRTVPATLGGRRGPLCGQPSTRRRGPPDAEVPMPGLEGIPVDGHVKVHPGASPRPCQHLTQALCAWTAGWGPPLCHSSAVCMAHLLGFRAIWGRAPHCTDGAARGASRELEEDCAVSTAVALTVAMLLPDTSSRSALQPCRVPASASPGVPASITTCSGHSAEGRTNSPGCQLPHTLCWARFPWVPFLCGGHGALTFKLGSLTLTVDPATEGTDMFLAYKLLKILECDFHKVREMMALGRGQEKKRLGWGRGDFIRLGRLRLFTEMLEGCVFPVLPLFTYVVEWMTRYISQ